MCNEHYRGKIHYLCPLHSQSYTHIDNLLFDFDKLHRIGFPPWRIRRYLINRNQKV